MEGIIATLIREEMKPTILIIGRGIMLCSHIGKVFCRPEYQTVSSSKGKEDPEALRGGGG